MIPVSKTEHVVFCLLISEAKNTHPGDIVKSIYPFIQTQRVLLEISLILFRINVLPKGGKN